ncbi:MAG: hypothetical protein WCO26_14290 [Deltaproteobacteria bacterium]
MGIDAELLKHLSYFEGCSPAELQWIKQYLSKKEVNKGQIVVHQGIEIMDRIILETIADTPAGHEK